MERIWKSAMEKGNYGKEPFDLRLTLLRIGKNLHWMLLWSVIGTLLLGGGYYLKKVVFRPAPTYLAQSTYLLEFVSENWAQQGTYINETTWNYWVHSEIFLEGTLKHLAEQGSGYSVSREELDAVLSAKLASDLRIPSTMVLTGDSGLSEAIAAAVEKTMTEELAGELSHDVTKISVTDSGVAKEVKEDVRPLRAFVLAAVLSVLFVVAFYFYREIMDDSIWLPSLLQKRYGLKELGTVASPECKANLEYLLRGRKKVGICSSSSEVDTKQVKEELEKLSSQFEMVAMPAPLLSPESFETLRGFDGVILVVEAGEKTGKPFEYMLELLEKQDVHITAALLWNADERLIRNYYRLGK